MGLLLMNTVPRSRDFLDVNSFIGPNIDHQKALKQVERELNSTKLRGRK